MRTRWWIAAPIAWVGVVVVVALLAWWVIDDAGEGVLAEPARDAITPAITTDPTTSASSPTRSGRSQPPTGSTANPTTGPTGGPTDSETAPVPPPTSAEPPPTAPGQTDPPEQAGAVRRTSTWQGEEGLLRVSCTGPELTLEGATPADGYEIDRNERRSGSELEVRFRSTDGDRRVEIEVACVGGVPSFSVERSD